MKKIPQKVQEIRDFKAEREEGSRSISFSQLSLYVSCPSRWYRAYVLNEAPNPPSIHTVFGTAVHETLQTWLGILYNETVKASEELDLGDLLNQNLRRIYAKDRKAFGKDFTSAEELEAFYRDGVEILTFVRKHRKSYFPTGKGNWLVGCEIPILYKLQDKFYFKGFIDVLTYDEQLDRWKIWDIKTSTNGWSLDTKKDFLKTSQVLLYKEFLSRQFGIDKDKIDVEYFIVKRKVPEEADFPSMKRRVQEFSPSAGTRSVKKAVALVETFTRGALDTAAKYQDREYETTPSKVACRWCSFRDTCKDVII